RVKAKETASDPEIELHFRAWSRIGNSVYRTPEDSELGLEEFSANKTSLYAETMGEKIRVLEPSASCENDLCASYKFVRSDGSEYSIDNFRAVLGELYALQADLSPKAGNDTVTVKASTAKQKPKIAFQGYGIDRFSEFPDLNSQDTGIQVDNVVLSPQDTTSVRLYFKANEIENSSITLQLISGETVINEQFYFNVFREKNILLSTIPETVKYGEDFSISLTDEAGNGIEKAEIMLDDSAGEHLETISGDGTANNGGGGRYLVKNSFGAGTIKYTVNAEGFKEVKGTIEVTKTGIISWADDEASIVIQKGQQSAEKFLDLENNSKQGISQLSFTVEPLTPLPEGLTISVTPLSGLGANSKQRIVVVAEYSGEKESEHAEVNIIAKGRTETGFTVSDEVKIIVDYNPKISPDCLVFSKKKLAVFVASGFEDRSYYDSTYGTLAPTDPSSYYKYNNFSTTATESFTASLANRSECQLELELTPEVAAKGKKNTGLEVESEAITLSPQLTDTEGNRSDTDEVTVSITNKIIRNYPGKEKFTFNILFKSEGFEKAMPVEVYVWNPRYALQVSRNIELYLGPDARGELSAQGPLFVRNVGEADIENVDFKISSATSRGNVDITVVPPISIQFLRKGEAIIPPKTLVAQALRNQKTTLLDVKQLEITGVIDGTTFDFGPVIITSHISADKCLVAVPGNMSYISVKSGEGAIAEDLTLKSTCAEEVRVRGLSRSEFGNNRLHLEPADAVIRPGSEAPFKLVLDKREDFQGAPVPVYVKGFLVRSGAPIDSTPIIVDVKLGKYVKEGQAASEIVTLNVCEGGSKDVRFPIVASSSQTPLCDSAYCDSVQLSEFLADRIEQKINDAQKQIQNFGAEVDRSTCGQQSLARGYCTFDELGVKREQFFVYFAQDNLSPALLQKSMDKRQGLIRGFRADFFEGKSGGEYLGGYGKQVFLNDNFKGCGRYSVTLNGSVAVQGGAIVPELMNVVIDLTDEDGSGSRQQTEQCLPRIQNFSNFLPVDKDLTKNEKLDAWIGVVEAKDSALEDLSKDVAKTLLETDKRAVEGAVSANKLTLDLGNNEGYIVKVEMDKVATENPLNMRAFVRENVVEGCIGEDESYFLLKSSKDISKIALNVKGDIPVQYGTAQCTDLNVSSTLGNENVDLSARKSGEFDGITGESPFFYAAGQDEGISSLKVEKFDEKTNKYVANARVCVTGNSQLAQAQGKEIIISAKPSLSESKKPVEAKAKLAVCGVSPLKLLETIKGKKDGTYYATVLWKGAPERIFLEDLKKLNNANDAVSRADAILKGESSIQEGDSPEVVSAKRKAAGGYLAACGLTSIGTSLLRPIIGWGGALFNFMFDCVLPFTALIGHDVPILSDIFNFTDEIFKTINKTLEDTWVLTPVSWLFKAFGLGDVSDVQTQLQNATTEDVKSNVIEAFLPWQITKDIVAGAGRTFSPTQLRGPGQIKIISGNIANSLAEQVSRQAFGDPDSPFKKPLSEELSKQLAPELEKVVKRSTKVTASGLTTDITEEQILEATKKVIETVGKDETVFNEFYQQRSSLKGELKAATLADEAVDGFLKEADFSARITGSTSFNVPLQGDEFADDSIIRGSSQFTNLEGRVKDEIKSRLKSKLNVTSLPSDVESGINNLKLDFEAQQIYQKGEAAGTKSPIQLEEASHTSAKISKDNVKNMVEEAEVLIKNDAIKRMEETTAVSLSEKEYQKALQKKFGSTGYKKLAFNAADAFKDARPKLWSKTGWKPFLLNILKEGA
ncbi:MAG TPA: hypothetical protein VFF09_04515, partial [archaeon]|nr:hypothetical protein [archaeon]